MQTTCDCTLRRLLSEEEGQRVEQLIRDNSSNHTEGFLLAEIAEFSGRHDCPHLHRFGENKGFCTCQGFLQDWAIELGETAGLHGGRTL